MGQLAFLCGADFDTVALSSSDFVSKNVVLARQHCRHEFVSSGNR